MAYRSKWGNGRNQSPTLSLNRKEIEKCFHSTGEAKYVTIWTVLTDATPENSCLNEILKLGSGLSLVTVMERMTKEEEWVLVRVWIIILLLLLTIHCRVHWRESNFIKIFVLSIKILANMLLSRIGCFTGDQKAINHVSTRSILLFPSCRAIHLLKSLIYIGTKIDAMTKLPTPVAVLVLVVEVAPRCLHFTAEIRIISVSTAINILPMFLICRRIPYEHVMNIARGIM